MHRTRALLLLLPLLLTGCAVRLIAPYDQNLDTTMTQVQQDTETFFTQLQFADPVNDGSYDKTKAFYLHTEPTLRTLLTRAQAAPKSQAVADQIGNLLATMELLRTTHQRDTTLNPTLIDLERATLESQFRSFFALELALKTHGAGPSAGALAPATKK